MQIDVAQSIRAVLNDRHKVSLTGLGSFWLVNKPAKFGNLRQSILPPSVDLKFELTTSSNTALVEQLCLDNKISHKKAELAIKKYSESVLNGLLNYGKVYLNGIAVIEKNKKGDINIDPDKEFLEIYYKGLPEIPIKLVSKRIKDTVSAKTAEFKPPQGNETIEASVVTSGSSVISSILKSDSEEKIDNTLVAPTAPEKSVIDASITEDIPYYDEKEDAPKWIRPLMGIALLLLVFFLAFQTCNYIKKDRVSEELQEQALLSDNNEIDVIDPNEKSQEERTDALPLTLPDKCTIITGSFGTQNNVERMEKKLIAEGYSIFTETYGPYTRIGISFDCTDVDLESYIRMIRSTISSKAWYLDPELYVEY